MKHKKKFTYHFYIAAALAAAAYIFIYAAIGQGIFSHSLYDSYTRQAAAWWNGSAGLPGDVSWLEIAAYNGRYFVSFPPFPSVIQFIMLPLFGMEIPDSLLNSLFGLGSFVLIYMFLMKRGFSGFAASVFAVLMTAGSNLLYLSAVGWVWYSAQTQGFFFSVLAVYLIFSKKPYAWYFSFLSLGIAFACRPFQLVYAPLLLYMLYEKSGGEKSFIKTVAGCIKYTLPLIFTGVCVAAYNYIRFGDIFEFGHNYLPEFQDIPQFSFSYIPGNFLEILKLPEILNGSFEWPRYNGTLFFLVNPVFIALAVSLVRKFGKRQAVYFLCFAVHFVLLLTHKTMGGWQFGARYLVDLIPFMLIAFEGDESYKTLPPKRKSEISVYSIRESGLFVSPAKANVLPTALAVIGIAINIWGAVWLYTQININTGGLNVS
jgi:hypothetical protein